MNRLVRRYIILFLAIIIPLAAAFGLDHMDIIQRSLGKGHGERVRLNIFRLRIQTILLGQIERYLEYE